MSTEGDSYLEIAERLLRRARTPLSTKQIMDLAYMSGEVPHHLFGATQHKTLGARLSEDILKYRKRSRFFRTRPGRFFLREFIADRSLPIEFRTPIVASRRRRQLRRKNVAAIDRRLVSFSGQYWHALPPDAFAEIVRAGGISYVSLDNCPVDLLPIYSYVIIRRGDQILVHTKGSYAESRRGYVSKEMLGFPVPICHDDLTLFDIDDHGIVAAGLTAVANDLDLEFSAEFPSFEVSAEFQCLVPVVVESETPALVGIVPVEAPPNFEPIGRRLAVGNLEWRPARERWAKYGFDPWSRDILAQLPSIIEPKLL
jgi:hypothetical protein